MIAISGSSSKIVIHQTGLIWVLLAAGAPALPKLAEIAKVDTAAVTGLMVLFDDLTYWKLDTPE